MNCRLSIKTLIFTLLLVTGQNLFADTESLKVSPQKCVALKQGNICYQDIGIKWQSPEIGHYCLYLETRNEPLKCWENADSGQFSFEFSESDSSRISLRNENSNELLGESRIEVKWVYKSKRKSTSWRVF